MKSSRQKATKGTKDTPNSSNEVTSSFDENALVAQSKMKE
jgi:hypothetical protein